MGQNCNFFFYCSECLVEGQSNLRDGELRQQKKTKQNFKTAQVFPKIPRILHDLIASPACQLRTHFFTPALALLFSPVSWGVREGVGHSQFKWWVYL